MHFFKESPNFLRLRLIYVVVLYSPHFVLVYTLMYIYFLHFPRRRNEVTRKLGRAGGSSFSMVELPVNIEGNALERKEPELQKILMRIAGL